MTPMNTTTKPAAKKRAEPSAERAATPAPKKRTEPSAERAANPFLDGELYTRTREYSPREAIFSKEMKAINERGAGKRNRDPLQAPSLAPLLGMVKKGLSLEDMFGKIIAGADKGLWEGWMETFGFEIRSVNYAPTGKRNAVLALDLGITSKANALFAKEGVPNWRSLVVEDCAELKIRHATEKTPFAACAIFYLDK
jgi:hypothetical protein